MVMFTCLVNHSRVASYHIYIYICISVSSYIFLEKNGVVASHLQHNGVSDATFTTRRRRLEWQIIAPGDRCRWPCLAPDAAAHAGCLVNSYAKKAYEKPKKCRLNGGWWSGMKLAVKKWFLVTNLIDISCISMISNGLRCHSFARFALECVAPRS